MWLERSALTDDPFMLVMNQVRQSNTASSRLMEHFIMSEVIDFEMDRQDLLSGIRQSSSSRRLTYKECNPSLSVHYVYTDRHSINEIHRLSFTRFRVSSHNLVCETGRWNRRGRGRLPLEERLCVCGLVQTERHVVQQCPRTHHIRQSYSFNTIEEVFSDQFTPDISCKIIHEILSTYD